MPNPALNDPVIILRRDLELEDWEDSRSLRVAVLVAVAFHALILSLALPAAEVVDLKQDSFCLFVAPNRLYARPAVPLVVPEPVESRICNLFDSGLDGSEEPIAIPDPPPRQDPPALARDVGVTPRLTACVEPEWTDIAKKARIQGIVILEILIREDGTVSDIRVLKGIPFGLGESAVEAVSKWRYSPIELKGEPVALRHIVVVRFEHGESNCPAEPIAPANSADDSPSRIVTPSSGRLGSI